MQNTYNAAAAGPDSTLLTVAIPRQVEPFGSRANDLSSIVAQDPLAHLPLVQDRQVEQKDQDHYRGSEHYF